MTISLSLILIMMSNFMSFTVVISNDFIFVSRSHKKKKYLIVLDLRQGLLKVMQHLGDGSNGLLYSQ